jgi:hypothetical protein
MGRGFRGKLGALVPWPSFYPIHAYTMAAAVQKTPWQGVSGRLEIIFPWDLSSSFLMNTGA